MILLLVLLVEVLIPALAAVDEARSLPSPEILLRHHDEGAFEGRDFVGIKSSGMLGAEPYGLYVTYERPVPVTNEKAVRERGSQAVRLRIGAEKEDSLSAADGPVVWKTDRPRMMPMPPFVAAGAVSDDELLVLITSSEHLERPDTIALRVDPSGRIVDRSLLEIPLSFGFGDPALVVPAGRGGAWIVSCRGDEINVAGIDSENEISVAVEGLQASQPRESGIDLGTRIDSFGIAAAATAAGDLVVVWPVLEPDGFSLASRKVYADGSLGSIKLLTEPRLEPLVRPSMAFATDGTGVVTWIEPARLPRIAGKAWMGFTGPEFDALRDPTVLTSEDRTTGHVSADSTGDSLRIAWDENFEGRSLVMSARIVERGDALAPFVHALIAPPATRIPHMNLDCATGSHDCAVFWQQSATPDGRGLSLAWRPFGESLAGTGLSNVVFVTGEPQRRSQPDIPPLTSTPRGVAGPKLPITTGGRDRTAKTCSPGLLTVW